MSYHCTDWMNDHTLPAAGENIDDLFRENECHEFTDIEACTHVDNQGRFIEMHNDYSTEANCDTHDTRVRWIHEWNQYEAVEDHGWEFCALCDLVFSCNEDLEQHQLDDPGLHGETVEEEEQVFIGTIRRVPLPPTVNLHNTWPQ